MSIYISYFVILNPKKGVWARNGYKFVTREEAQAELDTQVAIHGGLNNGWAVEEQGFWDNSKKKEDDNW